VEKSAQVLTFEQNQRKLREKRQDDKDKLQILAKKQTKAPTGVHFSKPVKSVAAMPILSEWKKMSEFELYHAALNAYDRNDEFGFRGMSQTFLRRFPKSNLCDDVIYLSGLMYLTQKQYGSALLEFNTVLKKHISSNRAASAQFAKGVTLKRMNLDGQAKHAFLQMKKSFAGSPEALRAESELKLLK
jgi:TolA-binding protein